MVFKLTPQMLVFSGFLVDATYIKWFCKMGCIFPMVANYILSHATFGPNNHRKDTPHFTRAHEPMRAHFENQPNHFGNFFW